jgi:hypothetical protein
LAGRFTSDEFDRLDERGACDVLNHPDRVAADGAAPTIEDLFARVDAETIAAAGALAGPRPFVARNPLELRP